MELFFISLQKFEPQEAKRIKDRLEIHYTPKHGSWLDMAEIELNAMTRQCLKAGNKHISGAIQLDPNIDGANQGHFISEFENTIMNLPEGHYVYQNGQFVKTQ